jgi:hypothetical protein
MENSNNNKSTDPITKQLEEDLAAVIRVRNRLAQSTDTALPKILAGLLPRLLARLEQNTTASSDSQSEVSSMLRNQMKIHLLGTLAHALERLRGNKDIPAAQWMPEILASLEKTTSGLVRTLTLTFLQVGLPRCTKADLVYMEAERGVSVIGSLLSTVDCLYRSLCETSTEQDADITKGSQTDLRSASWLCFDTIAILAGAKPFVDWDVDAHYDQDDGLGTGDESDDAFEFGDAVASTMAQEAVNDDGAGVFDLFLDLFLFSPHVLHENMEPTRGLSPEGIHRMCHRLQGNHQSWSPASESYLRKVKSTCFRYLICQEHPSLLLTSETNKTRALMLAVLLSCTNSNVGVPASEYLRSPAAREGCSFRLMCSLLVLVLGDDAARPLVEKSSSQVASWSEMLGPRPVDGSILSRLPLPASAASRVFRFMHENLKLSRIIDVGELYFFLQLLVAVSVRDEFLAKEFWAIRLIHKVCKQIDSLGLEEADWIHDFYKESLHLALEFLSVVAEPAEERQTGGDPLRQRQMHPVAPAVNDQADPMVRFQRRNTRFNQMMTKHRRSLCRKRLRHDDAVETREDAYDLVARLAPQYGILSDECISFDIPIKLFQCATYEDDFMQPRVVNCLRNLLSAYKSEISSQKNSFVTDTSFVLPALIGAACCDSSSARLAAAQWAEGLLLLTDALAAYHVACFLRDDTDPTVAKIGRTITTDFQTKNFYMSIDPPQAIDFINFSTDVGMQQVTDELNQRIANLSSELGIPSSATSLLLQEFDFDASAASAAFMVDSANVKQTCGIERRCCATILDVEMQTDEKLSCGVCYEDEYNASDMYSLPCGHRYCHPCWHGFIQHKLSEGPTSILTATCPGTKCMERITGLDILNVAPDLVPKWKKSLVQSFVERDQRHRFCPGTDCTMVVHTSKGKATQPYYCEGCHESFCFACGELPHIPARCSDLQDWTKIFGSSKFWIQKARNGT